MSGWIDRKPASATFGMHCVPPVLGYPDRNKPLQVILDAASTGLGYILVNVNEDPNHPYFMGDGAQCMPNEIIVPHIWNWRLTVCPESIPLLFDKC